MSDSTVAIPRFLGVNEEGLLVVGMQEVPEAQFAEAVREEQDKGQALWEQRDRQES